MILYLVLMRPLRAALIVRLCPAMNNPRFYRFTGSPPFIRLPRFCGSHKVSANSNTSRAMKKQVVTFVLGLTIGVLLLYFYPPTRAVSRPVALATTGSSCDSQGYLATAEQVETTRASRRIDEASFIRMAQEPNTIILDARSHVHYQNLHIKGSVNLPYTEFSEQTLSGMIPDKDTRVLIYCRNNLTQTTPIRKQTTSSKIEAIREFPYPTEFDPPKIPNAGLNIPTFITLHTYGYRDVWELDSQVDPQHSPIPFE